jgi:hypothetical protein
MAEVMFQMVSFGLEYVIVLILHFPADTTIGCDISNIFFIDHKVGNKGISIAHFITLTGLFRGDP